MRGDIQGERKIWRNCNEPIKKKSKNKPAHIYEIIVMAHKHTAHV